MPDDNTSDVVSNSESPENSDNNSQSSGSSSDKSENNSKISAQLTNFGLNLFASSKQIKELKTDVKQLSSAVGGLTTSVDSVKTAINPIQEQVEENRKLKSKKSISNKIKRYRNINVITIKNDDQKIKYCSSCWDNHEKLVQLRVIDNDYYECSTCKTRGYLSDSPDKEELR